MPWLVVNEDSQTPRVLEIATSPFRIGRRAGNHLVLGDFGASRDHSRIEREGEVWRLVDLGAANGTYLNGRRLPPNTPEPLEPGDEIQIGRAKLYFFEKPPGTELIEPTTRGLSDSTRMMSATPAPNFARSPDVVRSLEQVPLPHRVEYFTVLHELAKLLLGARELPEIGRTALDLLFRVLPVERAAIALVAAGEAPLTTLVEQTRKGDEHVTISQTIASWVLRERVAVITSDARHDPRFQRGESIHMYHIRSAMCVPLWSETDTLGVIYLDNLFEAHAFTEEELELVTAVANQVAIGMRQIRLSEQLRDEAIIRANLAGYHSPDVVDMILHKSRGGKSVAIEVTEEVVSVMFCDICGFTTLSERLGATEVADLLNVFFDRMTRTIFSFKGSVNKYIGDAIMAIFGAPIPMGDHSEQAVRAALAMQAEMPAVHESLPAVVRQLLAPDRLQIRIGVNSGRVVVGNIGSPQRMEFTVLGDPVNVAQRLESMCEPGKVWVGEETYAKTRDLFQYKDLGETSLKGKKRMIRVHELVS
jgi:adenylate cyclase